MADTWDDLDKSVAGGEWRRTGTEQAPQSFEDLDKHFAKRITSAQQREIPQTEAVQPIGTEPFEGGTLQLGPIDTKVPLPASVNRGLAQLGSGFSDLGLAYKQMTGSADKAAADEKAKLDAPLNAGIVGSINSLIGKTAPFTAVPYGWAPQALRGLGPAFEGILTGGAQGAFEPVKTGESRGANIGVGAAAGTLFPALTGAAKYASTPSEAVRPLVAAAEKEGIPLSMADVTTNKLIKAFRSFANDLPISGGMNEASREAQQEAFNKAVGSRYGSTATKHTEAQRQIDKKAITDVMDQVWNNNNLPYDANLFGSLRQMEANASKYPGETQNTILAHVKDLESKVIADPNGNLYIPGPAAKEFQTDLYSNYGNKAKPDALDNQMMQLRGHILDNFNTNVAGPDAAALTQARQQYRAFKAVEPALKKADVGIAQRQVGDVRPVDLSAGVLQQYKGSPARSPFGELPQVGQHFLRDTSPQTGGSARAMIQNSVLAGGALTGAGLLTDPITSSLLAGGFLAGNKAISSPALRKMLQKPSTATGQLLLQKPDATRAAIEYLANTMKRAPAAGALAGVQGFIPRVEVRGTRDDGIGNDEPSPLESTNR